MPFPPQVHRRETNSTILLAVRTFSPPGCVSPWLNYLRQGASQNLSKASPLTKQTQGQDPEGDGQEALLPRESDFSGT